MTKKFDLSRTDLDWDEILEEGEEILWQGQPDQDALPNCGLRFMGFFLAGIGLISVLVFLFPKVQGTSGEPAIVIMFFIIFLAFVFSSSRCGLQRMKLQDSYYTLTNKRAIIGSYRIFQDRTGTRKRRRTLQSCYITSQVALRLEGADHRSIYFSSYQDGLIRRPFGFERLKDGDKVLALFKQVQEENG